MGSGDGWARVVGLTPRNNFYWPSEVDGELGVPIELRPRSRASGMAGTWVFEGIWLLGLGLFLAGVASPWLMIAGAAGAFVLAIRSTVRYLILKHRWRRLWIALGDGEHGP